MDFQKIATVETIAERIYLVRGQKVMLDEHLAELYDVETPQLNRQVRRNLLRFPEDFAFQLTKQEWENLKCQIGISSSGWGGRRFLPYVFTEAGVSMLSSVLNSERAIQMNVFIIRAFVKLRYILSSHKELDAKLIELEKRLGTHDAQLRGIFEAIRELMNPPSEPRRRVGFRSAS